MHLWGNWKGTKMITIDRAARGAFAATLGFVILIGCTKSEPDEESAFRQGVRIEAAGKPIDVEVGHLVPRVCDWNNDGRKDLIVGQFRNGSISLYLNEGTNAAPVFGESSLLHASGKPIKLDAG